ncbi:hypothetical protein [Flavobacterium faecale]|uniref:hypothetical protein n=1 Tax=Flavobacterium faecale TaxID=1355330 RepID=UPI003AAE2B47
MKLQIVFNCIITSLFMCTTSVVLAGCSASDSDPIIIKEEVKEEVKEEAPAACTTGKLYNEKDGIVRVDLENPSATPNGWTTENTLSGFEGTGYLVWTGNDNFSTPGIGTIKFSVKITNPGTYQFVWSSRITQGTSNTEHNDSWLRIATAADFYGEKASTGERVYPKGTGKTPNPEGSSSNGWLKAYMNRVGEWFWRTSTNDKDPFNVFAKFDTAGVYDIEISGRSKGHAIDQFVLYKTDKTLSAAQTAVLSEITCK